MVRRWSYINQLNHVSSNTRFKIRFSSSDVIVNFLMYLRRDYPVASQTFRKNWARRKHANQFLFMSNVLVSWAKEYRFFRNYNRMLHHQFLFKNTYLAINVVIQWAPESEHSRHDNAVVGSAITRKSMKYFANMFLSTRFSTFERARETGWSYASYLEPYDTAHASHLNAPFTPLFHVPRGSLIVLSDEVDWELEWSKLKSLLHSLILFKTVSIYSSFVKLLILKLHTR